MDKYRATAINTNIKMQIPNLPVNKIKKYVE